MKLCLIGSSRFKDLYDDYNRKLSLAGHIVYSIAMISSSVHQTYVEGNGPPILSAEQKELLDLVHLRKILESDGIVLVTDRTGYYGESTRREIRWARLLGKSLNTFQSNLYEDWDSPWGDANRLIQTDI